MSALDWGSGRYEETARTLLPAARALLDRANPAAGERVLDVGCGTGNAALLAAERGAVVTGVDPSARLLAVAREAAAAQGLTVSFQTGDAACIPMSDGEADLIVSVFGVIFAPDVQAAARELARVLAPAGRIAISAWLPAGPLAEIIKARAQALSAAGSPAPSTTPFAWHEPEALESLFAPFGLRPHARDEHAIAFTAASPAEFVHREFEHHPMWVYARRLLGAAVMEDLDRRIVEIAAACNEDPAALRLTSRYVVTVLARPPRH